MLCILYGVCILLGFVIFIFILLLVIGLIIGMFLGYKGGWIDYILMRFCDGVMVFLSFIFVLGLVGIFGFGLL